MSKQKKETFFRRFKWHGLWIIFGVFALLFIILACCFRDAIWRTDALQSIGAVTGFYLTILIFLYSKADSDKQFKEHIEHLQKLTLEQITAVQQSSDQQITALQELNHKQIQALSELTDKQIQNLSDLNEKQIDALHQSTYEQISAFEKQTIKISDNLMDNSVLLAEILGRELEDAIGNFSGAVNREQAKYSNLQQFKLLRTPEQKESQLRNSFGRLQSLQKKLNYLVKKYQMVKNYLKGEDDEIDLPH